MQPAQRRGLADEAADRIREEILAGRFQPGSALREVDLAASLQVSRGSVREGLAVLEREGLVQSVWHKGTHVIGLTESDIDEVYAVRAALDRLAATSAAARARTDHLDELDALVDRMAEETDAARVLSLDMEFHEVIYRAANNRRLLDAWHAVRSQVRFFQSHRIRLSRGQYRARAWGEHRELAALIRGGDTERLPGIAEEHVHSARRALVEGLAQPPKS
ncbi:GntR family transcriptional regulator [Amycolatopsis acidiphila]|uniref:GntR family transcriptional regulator n=1 Tax=Amycolatopsis acidiphila TaxID=715473 RepID=A0A558A3F5_9PSEU|nr:GntR family transcriptional regulator [Amycolatopsis acidiphila]TVT18831.1 GntR family transcriptional regulator [Amycolatopsis acidiphila]UIJ61750.1 GntR family transcriptional regulator [Amycolatopsis acidiphila]GHG58067.1 GntR family transcriptional regulator [Amycolatopsis acidiphila]